MNMSDVPLLNPLIKEIEQSGRSDSATETSSEKLQLMRQDRTFLSTSNCPTLKH